VSFVIDPAHEVDPSDKCRTHSRESFRDLTNLLKLTLYVDFPDSPRSCRDKDPQRSKTAQNGQPSWLERLAALLEGNVDVQTASQAPEIAALYPRFLDPSQRASGFTERLAATYPFFAHNPVMCMAPALILTTAP